MPKPLILYTHTHTHGYFISNKEDYYHFIEADKKQLGRKTKHPKLNDYVWRYEIYLRKCEYYKNCKKGLINKIILHYYKIRRFKIGSICNFSIPLNVCGMGLSIAHIGPIIINPNAKIGNNCRIHVGVNIGTSAGKSGDAPIIGDNVYIGPGAKLFGRIKIANNIAIGANAVVNKSFIEEGIAIAGVPAKKINNKGSKGLI